MEPWHERGTLIVGINTDDGIILGSSQALVDEFRAYYDSKYTVRWGNITRYGGVNVTIDDEHNTISLDQRDFIEKTWLKWREHVSPSRPGGSRGAPLPTLPSRKLLEQLTTPQALAANTPTPEVTARLKEAVGDLGWYANRTRGDMLVTYNLLASALDKGSEELCQLAYEAHAYAYNTCHLRIELSQTTCPDPIAYCDANYTTNRSQSGFGIWMANACIISCSRRQKCVVLSTCEAELIALSAATCEVLWLRNLLWELGFAVDGPTPIYCDNSGAVAVANNPVNYRHLKHVDRRHFFVQDAVNSGAVTVPHVDSDKNLADILTKIYDSAPLFERMSSKLRSWVMRC